MRFFFFLGYKEGERRGEGERKGRWSNRGRDGFRVKDRKNRERREWIEER